MLALQVLALFLSRLCAKRKMRVRGGVKWLSLIDIALLGPPHAVVLCVRVVPSVYSASLPHCLCVLVCDQCDTL